MTYYVVNGLGDSIDRPSPDQMRRFLEDVDVSDEEHGAAWLSTDGGLTLEWNGDGRLVYSWRPNPVRHLLHVSREKTLQLWKALADDRVGEVEAEAWQPGNGHHPHG
ncbi:MAG: hypothetical protein HYV09_06345 [Deltaproteobacteria bacterium]|nr:hypothetical protein [Deltaproteobacteria bacterium]